MNTDTVQIKKQSRYSKGIAASRRILKVHNEDAWLVESETTDDKFYTVTEDGTCDCKDFENRVGPCKHLWALIRLERDSRMTSYIPLFITLHNDDIISWAIDELAMDKEIDMGVLQS